MYIPKNKIRENLYTSGKQYVLADTGEEYTGYYYSTYDGKFFTGKTPSDPSKEIIMLSEFISKPKTFKIQFYDTLINSVGIENIKNFKSIPYHHLKPTLEDYNNGFVIRYFSKRKNGGLSSIKEISKETFDDLQNSGGKYDYNLYQVIKLFWRINGDIKEVIKTNSKTLFEAEYKMPGISKYLNNLEEFVFVD